MVKTSTTSHMPTALARPIRIGLTGGIGSGKSTVAHMLKAMGCQILDADAISRASTAPGGRAVQAIAQVFGSHLISPDGGLNREAMRQLIFTQPEAKKQLESIIHPIVRDQIEQDLNSSSASCVVLDIPLLVESKSWQSQVDTIWVVDCSPETQIQRVMQRNGWSRQEVEQVVANQAQRSQRLALAHTVLDNDDCTLEQLRMQVESALRHLHAKFGL